jgi:hypothetical protein
VKSGNCTRIETFLLGIVFVRYDFGQEQKSSSCKTPIQAPMQNASRVYFILEHYMPCPTFAPTRRCTSMKIAKLGKHAIERHFLTLLKEQVTAIIQ